MSMRATFTTEFIYDASEGYESRRSMFYDILDAHDDFHAGTMIGRIAGVTKGSDLSEKDIHEYIEQMCRELEQETKVPFKIVWLFEGGDVLIKEIKPVETKKPTSQKMGL